GTTGFVGVRTEDRLSCQPPGLSGPRRKPACRNVSAVTPPPRRHLKTYLASKSVSRFTAEPGRLNPNVVRSRVWGIRATLKLSVVTSTRVRLTPSTATDPLGTIWAASSAGQENQTSSHSP